MALPPDVLDLHGMAAELGVSYSALQKSWRTTAGFPPPFWGAEPGRSPRWARAAARDFKGGRRWAPGEAAPLPESRALGAANDPRPTPVTDRAAALLAAAGG